MDNILVTHLPPEQRPTAMVFQQYALWPHMDVFHNIAFGLQVRKQSRQVIRDRIQEVLKLVRLEGYERSYPAQLSGGQQQRVALARALVLEPKVLLFLASSSLHAPKEQLVLRCDQKISILPMMNRREWQQASGSVCCVGIIRNWYWRLPSARCELSCPMRSQQANMYHVSSDER